MSRHRICTGRSDGARLPRALRLECGLSLDAEAGKEDVDAADGARPIEAQPLRAAAAQHLGRLRECDAVARPQKDSKEAVALPQVMRSWYMFNGGCDDGPPAGTFAGLFAATSGMPQRHGTEQVLKSMGTVRPREECGMTHREGQPDGSCWNPFRHIRPQTH